VAPAPLWSRTQEVRVALGFRSPLLRRAAAFGRPVRSGWRAAKAAWITGVNTPVRTWRDGPGVEDATVERREAACRKARGTARCQTET